MEFTELLPRLVRRVRYLVGRASVERDMADEMALHLELETEERIRNGMSPEEARRTALIDFGGVERFKEEGRTARGVRPIEDLVQDIRYALRVLSKSAGFTIACVLTVAIGIAATTSVFSVANAMLLRPPPVSHPERLVVVAEVWKSGDRSYETSMGQYMYRYAHYRDLRDASGQVFSGLAGFRYGMVSLRVRDEARAISSSAVSANYFDVLGIRPALGRFFSSANGSPDDATFEVVLGHDLWISTFAGDSAVIGRSIFVDSRRFTIVGVAPRGFTGTTTGLATDLWLETNEGTVAMLGRLTPGITRDQAIAELTAIGQHLPADSPSQRIRRMTLDPVIGPPAMSRGPVIGFMGMLVVTATLVLLIVAANIAGMFLARATYRRREIAVRLGRGAGGGRIIRQLLTESILICLVGGAIGFLLATSLIGLVPALNLPIGIRAALDMHPDGRVLAGSFAAALVAGVIAGLTPALQSARIDLLSALHGTGARGPKGIGRSRAGFVVAQLAMSLVLLLTAGLFTRAVQAPARIDRGLDAEGVVVAEVNVEPHGYDEHRGREFYAQLMARLRARPELASAGLGEWTPLSISHMGGGYNTPDGRHVPVTIGVASDGYLETVRIPVIAGRAFRASDTQTSNPVVIVNETLARTFWPNETPIGQHLDLNGTREVIGVIRDGKYRSLDEPARAFALLPFSQHYWSRMMIQARVRGDMSAGLAAVRAEVSKLDRNIALENVGPLSSQIDLYVLPQRVAAWCVGVFGLFGLGLAALGIYGVIAYHAAQRTRELGIRLALGARPADIVRGLLRPAVRALGIAVAIGLPVAFAIARLVGRFLYGVGALDPITFAIVPLLLGVVALLASYLPARLATRVDPLVSLRVD